MKPVGLFIAAVAAVVTPLGLYDGIMPATRAESIAFVYAADKGPFGSGTPARSKDMGYSRICFPTLCPDEPDLGNITYVSVINSTYNMTADTPIRSPELAQSTIDLYQSGLQTKPTVSGFFDVQYRQWKSQTGLDIINNSSYLVPSFQMLASLLTEGKYKIVEGLIVDMANGSVGFRNHTIPPGLLYGAEWEEDLLFLEPEAVCVNTNITAFCRTNDGSFRHFTGLIDKGGFVNIQRTPPYSPQPYPFVDGQRNSLLYERAYYAAWATNALIMQFLNITDPNTNLSRISSMVNREFTVNTTFNQPDDYLYFSRLLGVSSFIGAPLAYDYIAENGTYSFNANPSLPNPWNVTADMFDDVVRYSQSSFQSDTINITEPAITIGMVGGIGYQTDMGFEGSTDASTINSTWERPVYVCAAGTQANIKTVRFRYNSTTDNALDGLYVLHAEKKNYDVDSAGPPPIWGFETPIPRRNISGINPVWGIIDPARIMSSNLTTVKSPTFNIPHSDTSVSYETPIGEGYPVGDNMPAIRAPFEIWSTTMQQTSVTSDFQYTGVGNQEFLTYWQEMTQNETGIARALRLIFTDYATNYLVGTKGLHTRPYRQPNASPARRDSTTNGSNMYPVYVLNHRIRYHWIYAVPALVCICIVSSAVLLAIVAWMCGQGTITRLRYYLFNITSGRVFASFVYPDEHEQGRRDVSTDKWIERVGHKPIQITGNATRIDYPHPSDGSETSVHRGSRRATYVSVRQKDEAETDIRF